MWRKHPLLVLITVLLLYSAAGPTRGDPLPQAAASLRLHPPIGPPTTAVTAAGSGFGPQETVDLSFDSWALGTAHSGTDGRFSTEVRIPVQAVPGSHTLAATGEQSGASAEAPFTVRTDWTQFHFDPAHTGDNPYENVLSASTVSNLQLAWRLSARGSAAASSPVIVDGVAYKGAGGYGGVSWVFAGDAATGSVLWSAPVLAGGLWNPSVSDGRVYVAGLDHQLHAYDAHTGRLLWTTPGPVGGTAVAGGVVYVGDNANTLYAINPVTGDIRWTVDVRAGTLGAPSVAGGVVYAGTEGPAGHTVYAVEANTGHFRWTRNLGPVYGTLAVANGILYVGSLDRYLYALDASTGVTLWRARTGAGIESSPAVADGVVYVGSDDGALYAFDAVTGHQLWAYPTGDALGLASPVLANGVLYIGSSDDVIYALDAQQGTALWSFATGGYSNASPAVADGTLYVGSSDSHLYAFRLP